MRHSPPPDPSSPFPRPIPIQDPPKGGRPFHVEARPEERALIAEAFGLVSLDRLVASGILRPEGAAGRVRLEGRLEADVVQSCVVTLDDVPARIDAPLERLYTSDLEEEAQETDSGAELFFDLSSDQPVERPAGEIVDVGAVAVEQLALELDPYPRKPGALFTGCDRTEAGTGEDGAGKGAFVRLAQWRAGNKTGESR